jgi:ribosome-binding protein aMBF1 (putative translation factor)
MTTNKEKFLALVKKTDTKFVKELDFRLKNSYWLSESYGLAIKILIRLDELGWSKKEFAANMCISYRRANRILSGKQKFNIETLVKLQQILDIAILASYFEK